MRINPDCKTIPQLLRNVIAHIHPETAGFLVQKIGNNWEEISYKETLDRADAIAAYFLETGIQKGDRLALITDNSPEYVFYDQALQQIGCVNVSVYPTLSEHDLEYILKDSGAKTILAGSSFLFKKVLRVANNCPELLRIIPACDDYERYQQKFRLNAGVIGLNKVIAEGKTALAAQQKNINELRDAVLPSDLSALIYTSGTTGIPKGVMLSHANLCENVSASLEQITAVDHDELFLSFLPLSHVFERMATYYICCMMGGKIAFSQSLELLARNMSEVKPTVMNAVPRLLEKIHDKAIKAGTAAGGVKAWIFNRAMEVGKTYREQKESGKTPGPFLSAKRALAEKLVFSKIKEKTGGRLKFMISGGAALPKNVGEFFGNLGIKILEGYGLTETSPVMAVTEDHRQVYGTVGRVIPRIEVGIQDTETNIMHTVQTHETFREDFQSEEGEIIVRGHCVMKGYWGKPDDTRLAIDADGWFHTGDVGRFYKGNLQITDRIKNMLVNAFGKNIYPTPVENTYLKSQKIDQVFLVGDKREYITAIIVPAKETLEETFGLTEDFFKEKDPFIATPAIVSWIGEDIRKYSSELAKFERIKNFKVKRTPFSIEDGEITPTMKAKRKVIEKKYADAIDAMYTEETEAG